MSQAVSLTIKKILFTVFMTIVTTIIGILLNNVMNLLTNSMLNTTKYTKNLNIYERQIQEYIIKPESITDTLSNVGGLNEIKEDIRSNILLPLQYPHIFFSSALLMPTRGILLYGPPGTGKTLLARAIAHEANVPFISLALSSLENKYYGESSKLIQGAFSLARKIQPCIVFFDEIDGLLRKRTDIDQSATYGFKTELLAQIDGMSSKKNDSIFVIGTTNNISSLDAAIKRRLPKIYQVALPTYVERVDILKLKVSEEVDFDDLLIEWLAKITPGFSGSDLSDLIHQSCSIRLKEHCKNSSFKEQLKKAKDISELPVLCPLKKDHIQKALAGSEKFKKIVEHVIKENTICNEEEPPPPML